MRHGLATILLLATLVWAVACGRTTGESAAQPPASSQPTDPAPASDAAHAGNHGPVGAPSRPGAAGAEVRQAAEVSFLFPDGDDRGWVALQGLVAMFHHDLPPDVPAATLAPDVRTELLRQLNLTSDVIGRYPTVAHAEKAGFRRIGPYAPGIGAHWMGPGIVNTGGRLTDEQLLHPQGLLYDGISADSALTGIMYNSESKNPEGFAGPNDHWHSHVGVCSKARIDGGGETLGNDGLITKAQCEALGFTYNGATSTMLHVWTVPGYTNRLGVFSHANPAVTCKDGTYHVSLAWEKMEYLTNRCKSR